MQNPNKLNIHFILHEAFEVPGAYLKWAQWRGHNISATKVYECEALPDNVDDIDFLIVFGCAAFIRCLRCAPHAQP